MNQAEELKSLGRQNRGWRLTSSSAKVIVEQLAADELPLQVLPMRDVWLSGTRMRGMKPTVCLTDRQLIAVTHPGFLGRANSQVVNRSKVSEVSDYQGRSFSLTLSDGQQIKLRGLIGERKVEEMTERLYAALRSDIH